MQNNKAISIVVTRKMIDSDTLEKTLLPVSSIITANRDATDKFTYLRVVIQGRKFNWHVTETVEELNNQINTAGAASGA